MAAPSALADALTREHHEIDAGIESFVDAPPGGSVGEAAVPLRRAMAALARHIYLEEEIVFPPLRSGPLMMPIMVMCTEHGRMWHAMAELDDLLTADDVDEPANRDRVRAACRAMLELLEAHNSKEEPVIYPHVDADLDAGAQATLADFLETGTMPEGWVCERA